MEMCKRFIFDQQPSDASPKIEQTVTEQCCKKVCTLRWWEFRNIYTLKLQKKCVDFIGNDMFKTFLQTAAQQL